MKRGGKGEEESDRDGSHLFLSLFDVEKDGINSTLSRLSVFFSLSLFHLMLLRSTHLVVHFALFVAHLFLSCLWLSSRCWCWFGGR